MDLETRVNNIEERNSAVALDKGWETSWTRRLILSIFTYLTIGIYLTAINIPNSWLNAIVPTVAFMISTLAMPWFKKIWIKRQKNG